MAFRLAEEAWAASIRRPAAAVLICIVLVAGIAIGLGVRLFGSIQELRASVTHANEEIAAAGQVLDALQDAETGQRGFLLTMRPSYLEPYWNSTTGLDLGLKRLEGLAASTPWLQPEVAALTDSARQKMAELDRTVQLALTQGQQAALSVVLSDAGKAAMDWCVRVWLRSSPAPAPNATRVRRNWSSTSSVCSTACLAPRSRACCCSDWRCSACCSAGRA